MRQDHRTRRPLAVRKTVALAVGVTMLVGTAVVAAELEPQHGYTLIVNLMSDVKKDRRAAADELIEANDKTLVPALVDAYFYTPRPLRAEMNEVLEALTGEKHSSYYGWVEYVGGADIETKDRYIEWKLFMLRQKDDNYARILYPEAPTKIRLEEVISGGVPLDGIPSLDDPPMMRGSKAKYMRRDELVFGVEIDGESRAYPHRFLSWHEMLNDVVGEQPITLSYCTLCGTGILYSGNTPSGDRRTFGTSGLLYRSNKLMFDRSSYTLWSNITGEAVVGRLAGGDAQLEVLPMTLTTWSEWLEEHPETMVLDLKAVEKAMEGTPYRFNYQPGAADTARRGVSFPVWQKSDKLDRETEVFAIVVNGTPKAYPVERVLTQVVVNDEIAGEGLVLVANPDSGAIRSYARGDRRFRRADGPFEVRDQDDAVWRVTEQALEPTAGGEALPRLPKGHIAYWFGWYGYYPQTEVWGD